MLMKTPVPEGTTTTSSMTGARPAPKAVQTQMETEVLTIEVVRRWQLPSFQREFRNNAKVKECADFIKATEHVPGVLTLGVLKEYAKKAKDDPSWVNIVDGQHRIEGFSMSGLDAAYGNICLMFFDTMQEMAEEYYRLNDKLAAMTPDNKLKAMEEWLPALKKIRAHCEFVGYGQIRRTASKNASFLSMSSLVRCWTAAQSETPSATSHGGVGPQAQALDDLAANNVIAFLNTAYAAWSRDPEYGGLWNNLNLTLSMWLWQRLVMDRERRTNVKKYAVLNAAEFKSCLMALSANGDYVEWLRGRGLSERDRGPAYSRIKAIFSKRLTEARGAGSAIIMPKPAWATR